MKKHVDSDSPGDPDGVDAYRHFFYDSGWPVMSEAEWLAMSGVLSVPKGGVEWQVLEERVSSSENTQPETLQPEYQYPPSWRGHYGVAGVWSVRYTRHGGQVDAAVLRDENTDADDLCDDERLYYLNDANMNPPSLKLRWAGVTIVVEADGGSSGISLGERRQTAFLPGIAPFIPEIPFLLPRFRPGSGRRVEGA